MEKEINHQIPKRYSCDHCGHITEQVTNHFGSTWSWGRFNTCPNCPPFAKYAEFGGRTTWTCLDVPSDGKPVASDFNNLLEPFRSVVVSTL